MNGTYYPPIPVLMTIHVRKGDYASYCNTLASIEDPFVFASSTHSRRHACPSP